MLDPRWCDPAPPSELSAATEGRTVEAVTRRGKYLTLELSDEVYVVMHLRMTGNLLLVKPAEDDPDRRHLRVRFEIGTSGCCSWTSGGSAPAWCCWAPTRGTSTSPRGSASSPSAPTSPPTPCARWPRAGGRP